MGEVPADSVEARAQHWRRVCLWTSLGLLGWLLVRALARAGALSAFPAGQEHREQHAV